MDIFKIATSRMNITILLLVIQIAIIGFVASKAFMHFPAISYIGILASSVVFLLILKNDEASAYKMTWIIIILITPPLGGALYLLFRNSLPTRRITAHIKEHALIAKLLDKDGNLPFINRIQCGRMYSLMQYIRSSSAYHAYKNTQTKYYPLGEQIFEDMLIEISKAEKFIFLEYFIIYKSGMWDRLLDVLINKAAEGIEVRLIVDDFGSQKLFTNTYISQLRAKGIKILRFNPMLPVLLLFMNNRDHRKITVIDGRTAFTGGINISDEYIGEKVRFGIWKDTGIKLQGEAVWSFTLMFIEMWDTFCKTEERINDYESYKVEHEENIDTDGFIIPFGDSPLEQERLGENVYMDILNQAEHYCYIFTPYLIISEKMIQALQMTAKRGIDVRIVTPGIPDKKIVHRLSRSYYRNLIESGVRIYEYTPGFLHAKSFVCDDNVAVIGTINLDYRSLYLHFECAALLYGAGVIDAMKEDAVQTLSESKEILLDGNGKRRFASELFDAVLHLFAPLM